jgi:hypothetical protein
MNTNYFQGKDTQRNIQKDFTKFQKYTNIKVSTDSGNYSQSSNINKWLRIKMCQCIYQLGAFVNRSEGGESVKATVSESHSDLNEYYPYITGETLKRVKAHFMNLY